MKYKKIIKRIVTLVICIFMIGNVSSMKFVNANTTFKTIARFDIPSSYPYISLVQNYKEIIQGQNIDLLFDVTAIDKNGKDLTDRIQVTAPDMVTVTRWN